MLMTTVSISYCDLDYHSTALLGRRNLTVIREGRHWPSGREYQDVEYDGITFGCRQPWDGPEVVRPAGACRVAERIYLDRRL